MTYKTKMSNLESYQELSLQITTLSMKLDKVLELLLEQQSPHILTLPAGKDADLEGFKRGLASSLSLKPSIEIQPVMINLKEQAEYYINTPLRWPNESHTDYLKRIVQYNETISDDEKFSEEFK